MLLLIQLNKDSQDILPLTVLVVQALQDRRRLIVLTQIDIGIGKILLIGGILRLYRCCLLNTGKCLVFEFQGTIIVTQIEICLGFRRIDLHTPAQQVKCSIIVSFGALTDSLQEESVVATTGAD